MGGWLGGCRSTVIFNGGQRLGVVYCNAVVVKFSAFLGGESRRKNAENGSKR